VTQAGSEPVTTAEDEVVDLCRELIQIDTSNYGDESGPGERRAAEYVAAKLAEVDLQPEIFESHPGRANVIVRVPGEDQTRGALLIHGHLDVVPAEKSDWRVDPFSGEIEESCVWGRGAIDMKDMDAMTLAVVRQIAREGRRPPRNLVVAFVADEEAGSGAGARWLVNTRPDLFEGCTEAIGEVGGFSYTISDERRLYLIQTAEKGMAWLRLIADGTAGHGSMINDDNAVTELTEAVARLGRHRFPIRVTRTVRAFLGELSDALGIALDPNDIETTVAKLAPIARLLGATLRNTANPTMLAAGYKVNVIPGRAEAYVDGRFLPGHEEEFFAELDELLGPQIRREFVNHDIAVETDFSGDLVDAMAAALVAEDPGARAIPYTVSAGTDAKSFSRLGIRCFGFSPLRLPPDLDFAGMFHGVDERVPVDALTFGTRVLDRFLATC
jgi:acetylornithine deacetylase/succinyl-diaminopimelate desuccinylase-like protein